MFSSKRLPTTVAQILDNDIAALHADILNMQNEITKLPEEFNDIYMPPEVREFHIEQRTIGLNAGITASKERVRVLQKMKTNDPISTEEKALLLKVKYFQKPIINDYPCTDSTPTPRH